MKSKSKFFLFFILIILFTFSISNANEQFNFDVTEIEISQNGNKFSGRERGIITTNDDLEIQADTFDYNKTKNILIAKGFSKKNYHLFKKYCLL